MLFSASGDPALGQTGGAMLHDVGGRERLASEAPDRKARAELHTEQMRKIAEQRAAMANPAYAQSVGDLYEKYTGQRPAEGTPGEMLQMLLSNAEKGYQVDENRAGRQEVATTRAQGLREQMQARQDARAAADASKQDAADNKRWTLFGQELDPTKAKGGEMGKVVNSLTQYGKVRQLLEQSPNPNSTQMYEMARAFDRAVSGGVPTASGTEHLIPKTALGSASDFAQWLTNSPVGRNQQAFIKQLTDSVDREEKYGQGLLRDWQGKKASRFADLAGKDKTRFLTELQNWGLDEGSFEPQTWGYKGQPKAQPADPAVAHYKTQLQPGERLAKTPEGQFKALGKDEALPAGWAEVP